MGVCTLAYPCFEAFALPIYRDKQLSQPTSRMYIQTHSPYHGHIEVDVIWRFRWRGIKHHPWTSTVAVSSDRYRSLRSSKAGRKRLVNVFSKKIDSPTCPSGLTRYAKICIIFIYNKYIRIFRGIYISLFCVFLRIGLK